MAHEIFEVSPGSIADEMGLCAGDILLRIDGAEIADVFDYKFAVCAEELLLEIEKPGGEILEWEIEKDADEDLGLAFCQPLMSEKRRCCNKCVFCFVDQQPPGLRDSLYFKDDDVRLSFLHGNYVTLTNLSEGELRRIAGYHLSPLRISVHTTDPELRKKMMGSKCAANLFSQLKILSDAGIEMHFQAVLCKGYNDGEELDRTMRELANLPGAASLAIVPAGITRHRDGLAPLSQFSPEEARAVLAQVSNFPGFVYAADEWYIMAGEPLPPYESYGDFPQLDNGVGLLRLFSTECARRTAETSNISATDGVLSKPVTVCEVDDIAASAKLKTSGGTTRIGIVTGEAAGDFMRGLADKFVAAVCGVEISVYVIKNNFFGENITVSGLLTGADILAQLPSPAVDVLFLPENAFRTGTQTMLDGTTREQLSAALGVPIEIGSANGSTFAEQIINLGGFALNPPQGDKSP